MPPRSSSFLTKTFISPTTFICYEYQTMYKLQCQVTLTVKKIKVVRSKSFRPDQLFKVTEIKQLC